MMGGFTCCVPGCFNNNKRERHLKYYQFPKDPESRNTWIKNIGRKGKSGLFKPTTGHRVCSAHFRGGQKTYMIRTPTIFPLKNIMTSSLKQFADDDDLETTEDNDTTNTGTNNNTADNIGNEHSYSLENSNSEYLMDIIRKKDDLIYKLEAKSNEVESELRETRNKLKQCQADLVKSEAACTTDVWRRGYDSLNTKLARMTQSLQYQTFSVKTLKDKPEAVKFYTGFESYKEFLLLYNFLQPDLHLNIESRKETHLLSNEDQLLLVLVRLKVGLLPEDLAIRFGIHPSDVSEIWRTYLDLMYLRFRQIPIWPSRNIVDKYMPECFKQKYPNTRIILNCIDLFIESPSHFNVQSESYYRLKGLIGLAPNGFISFVNDLVLGNMSHKETVQKSGLIDLLQEGDSVMANFNFLMNEYLAEKKIQLNILPFTFENIQLSEDEINARHMANVRVYIEHALERVKNYQLLSFVFPSSMANELNKIWVICCYLVNFTGDSIVDDNTEIVK